MFLKICKTLNRFFCVVSLIVFCAPPKENLYLSIQEELAKAQAIFNFASTGRVLGGVSPPSPPEGPELEGGKPSIQGVRGERWRIFAIFQRNSHKSALSPAAERREPIRFNKIFEGHATIATNVF